MLRHIDATDAEPKPALPVKSGLQQGYSLEITAKDIVSLESASQQLAPGTQVSITFLPGETMGGRVAAAAAVRRLGFEPVPHISARRLESAAALDAFLGDLVAKAAVKHVFVIAGDPDRPAGPYRDSLDLIRSGLLERHGITKVGIAGYPEGHPQIDQKELWSALREKIARLTAAGFDHDITTQFSFDPQPVINWVQRVRESGITAPLRLGVPGPAGLKTLLRFAARCGVGASANVMAKYGLSLGQLLSTAGPDRLVATLAHTLDASWHDRIHLHFYPFGGLGKTAEWIHDFTKDKT